MISSSLNICHILYRLLESSPSTSSMNDVQHCIQQIKCLKQERIAEDIEEVLRSQRDGVLPFTNNLIKVIQSLNLTSNQEL
ncbi:hypothetical protein SLEP1_g14333 [Rubroshorea leprosula]|uniref:PUB2-4-like N-terminal domain-containing protein n=1 Tax=Rubroshorea leprosula TaxID=152421 RepID=A0AAV5IN52_9ROSI|nr:hypothetical protein SLEP1_g14333 [Rubroshorea leprosula]